jgi:L-fucose mutarotase
MLKNLNRLHTPELLHLLASMGHGDEIALVDAHYPAVSMARRLVRLDAADLPHVLDACLALMPLDSFVPDPALRMEVVGNPGEIPAVQRACQEVIDRREGRSVPLVPLERHAFYARSREAFGIIATGEIRPYGCILVTKGVVLPA